MTIVVDIAGCPVRFTTTSAPLVELLKDRYRNFLLSPADSAARPVSAEFQLDVVQTSPCEGVGDLRVEARGGIWQMSRGDFAARWDPASGRGHIRQTLNPYSTDSVLRIVQSLLLSSDDGFLLHASSMIHNGRAHVFTGPSGAGKTTMTRLAPSDAVLLTDEISCLRRAADGWRAYGTPFAGELRTSGECVSAPVAALYRLEQGAENAITPLGPAEAVRTVMRNLLFFTSDVEARGRVLATVCDLRAAVPVRRLTFTPHPAVWTALA
jgi:hypothetical protein